MHTTGTPTSSGTTRRRCTPLAPPPAPAQRGDAAAEALRAGGGPGDPRAFDNGHDGDVRGAGRGDGDEDYGGGGLILRAQEIPNWSPDGQIAIG